MKAFYKALVEYLGEDNFKKIQNVKVGIAGAGGLGSNCAFNLVRSGFLNFKIVDFDVIEPSNLNRQFYFKDQVGLPKVIALEKNLKRINSELKLEMLQKKIVKKNVDKIFKDCEVVVEAFDKAEYKSMIVESYYDSGKLLVSASGLAGWGKSDDIVIKKVHSKFFIIGDMVSDSDNIPPISPRVNVAAAKQADIILDYVISDKGDQIKEWYVEKVI